MINISKQNKVINTSFSVEKHAKWVRKTKRKWGKFYPKKSIKIGGVKLSTQISDVKIFYPEELSKKNLSKDLILDHRYLKI